MAQLGYSCQVGMLPPEGRDELWGEWISSLRASAGSWPSPSSTTDFPVAKQVQGIELVHGDHVTGQGQKGSFYCILSPCVHVLC
jgi:hypothetical protein